jgi:hypothetical protein
MAEDPKPPPPETEQVIEIKKKVRDAFSVFDREGRNACDVREVGTIIRSLNIYPTEKQLQRWIHEVEEEEPTGFILYEKVSTPNSDSSGILRSCLELRLQACCRRGPPSHETLHPRSSKAS